MTVAVAARATAVAVATAAAAEFMCIEGKTSLYQNREVCKEL
jgi:hypothetical protein